jgi:predicted MFS family arabinose efflux permease
MQVRIFRIRPFLVENLVLGIAMLAFIPVFFFASEYAQISLGKTASEAGLFLLYFFIGFVITAQIGGRMLDRGGAKRPVVLGCALAAVGFSLWAGKVTQLRFSSQEWYVILAGAGMGFMLGPASTDAVNRASRLSYGEATGITQTVRNYAASLGLAILGTVLVTATRSRVTASLVSQGVPHGQAAREAATISQSQGGSGTTAAIPHFIRLDFADAIRTVFFGMAIVMAVATVVGLIGLKPGLQDDPEPGGPDSTGEGSIQPEEAARTQPEAADP